jgi:hypothetical protein
MRLQPGFLLLIAILAVLYSFTLSALGFDFPDFQSTVIKWAVFFLIFYPAARISYNWWETRNKDK